MRNHDCEGFTLHSDPLLRWVLILVRPENVRAMQQAIEAHRRYPIDCRAPQEADLGPACEGWTRASPHLTGTGPTGENAPARYATVV